MKKRLLYSFIFFISTVCISSCSSEIKDGTTDIDEWPMPMEDFDVTISHPCMLHTAADFNRVKDKVNTGAQPWLDGWNILIANDKAQETYVAYPTVKLIRGGNSREEPENDNYARAMYDVAAAYQLGLRWKISGDDKYAEAAVKILNAWASTCKMISGDPNKYLTGIYGYQFANAAEILRDYEGWAKGDFDAYKKWMVDIFWTLNKDFLDNHCGMCNTAIWSNWDMCNMASGLAIGILCDDKEIINYNLNYFKRGAGNGSINNAVVTLHTYDGVTIGQGQESGRDQGHATLTISLYGAYCQMAYNIGVDFFGYDNNKILALSEYIALYNLAGSNIADTDMPFTKYSICTGETHSIVSSDGRGTARPSWELIYNHYAKVKKVPVKWTKDFAEQVRPEGGGGNYGPNSGGYDQLGFGTLMYTLE